MGCLITPVFTNRKKLFSSFVQMLTADRTQELWLQQLQKTELITLVPGKLIYYLALKNEKKNLYAKFIWGKITIMK